MIGSEETKGTYKSMYLDYKFIHWALPLYLWARLAFWTKGYPD